MVRPPSWLPRRWSFREDWPRRILGVNLILQLFCLVLVLLVLLVLLTYPLPVGPSFDLFVLTFLSGYGILAAIVGIVIFLGGQVRSFLGWLEKVLSPSFQTRKRRWATIFLTHLLSAVLVYVTLWLGYPVPLIVLALICAWGVGVAIVGVSPFYWLARRWELQHQQKLILGTHRRLLAVDWNVEAEYTHGVRI